jgi:hypothetical protein
MRRTRAACRRVWRRAESCSRRHGQVWVESEARERLGREDREVGAGERFDERRQLERAARPPAVDQQKETPGIEQLEVQPLLLSPGKRHGKRTLSAQTTTPGGTAREVSATVEYTLPPEEGERESAAKRRREWHHHREQKKLRALDFSGVGFLYEALLVKPEWIARNTTNLEEGSFVAGELQRDDEGAYRRFKGKRLTPACGFGDLDIQMDGQRDDGQTVCGGPTVLTCCDGETDYDAVLAAWGKVV